VHVISPTNNILPPLLTALRCSLCSAGSDAEGNEDRCQKCGSGTHTTKECKSQPGGKKNDPKRTLKCFICGKRGHTRDECSSGLEPGLVKFKVKGKAGLKVSIYAT